MFCQKIPFDTFARLILDFFSIYFTFHQTLFARLSFKFS